MRRLEIDWDELERAKSVTLTEAGVERAQEIAARYED